MIPLFKLSPRDILEAHYWQLRDQRREAYFAINSRCLSPSGQNAFGVVGEAPLSGQLFMYEKR